MKNQPIKRTDLDGETANAQATGQSDVSRAEDANQGGNRGPIISIGLGLITGAADDDPSAIGTYAIAGAQFGVSILWIAPLALPMMVAVVYLSAKLGQVTGCGLFEVIRRHYSRCLLYGILAGVLVGNIIEAGADLGAIAAVLAMLVPVPVWTILLLVSASIVVVQFAGSYLTVRNILRWLSLALLAYVGSAILVKPAILPVLKGTFIPTIKCDRDFLAMVVAMIGTALSAYLFTWQSNEEVEEKIAKGRRRLENRRRVSGTELNQTWWDVAAGMLFSNIVIYFVMLSTAATLFKTGHHKIDTAAQAAQALVPLAGRAAGLLFAIGVAGVGFLAVPVMTTGAAYDLCQAVGWRNGLYRPPSEAKAFYAAIVVFTILAVGMNFIGINPMRALVFSGIVQGFSTPPLMLLVMLITNSPSIMGNQVNSRSLNLLGWITTGTVFAATIGLMLTWIF